MLLLLGLTGSHLLISRFWLRLCVSAGRKENRAGVSLRRLQTAAPKDLHLEGRHSPAVLEQRKLVIQQPRQTRNTLWGFFFLTL